MFLAGRDELLAGEQVLLSGSEARHAMAVRRLKVGERIDVADGAGLVVEGVCAAVRQDELAIDVRARRQEQPHEPRLTVIQALAKGDRDERAVEAMTEAGVDTIVPWQAARCVTRMQPGRSVKMLDRWNAKGREATKQSHRAFVPEIPEPVVAADVTQRLAGASLALVLESGTETRLASLAMPGRGEIVVVVGPEGGLTPEELTEFASAGAVTARLGPTILRTSTAGVAAAAIVLAESRRW